jgi:hypothetical protein
MKYCILAFFALASFASAQSARDYMEGQISRDVEGALERAVKADMPVALVTYNPDNKARQGPESANEYSLRCFFSLEETRKLMSENFIQIFAPWSAKGVDGYLDKTDKTNLPVIIFLDKTGKLTRRVACQANPTDAMKTMQKIVEETKKK